MPSVLTRSWQPIASKRHRRAASRLVTELAARLRWPPMIVAVVIPPEIMATLRTAAARLDPSEWYEVELARGYWEVDGSELIALADALVSLADAQTAGDEPAARRALGRLCDHGPH